jgi:hypothetical protein
MSGKSHPRYTRQQIEAALIASRGTIYIAARSLGCSTNTIYAYMKRYPTLRDLVMHERGLMIDTAELALYHALERGEAWAVSLTLKTIGRSRGYVERQEITGADGEPVEIVVHWPDEPA